MDQNIDFSGSDQIQTLQYPDIHPPSQEISDEVFQAKGDLMKSIQTFLEEFNYISFEERPRILLEAWYKFFTIQHAQPEDSNELFQKLLKDLKELAEYVNSPSRDRPIFSDNNEDHSVQNKEYSSNEIASSNSNQEKEGPPQDSNILAPILSTKEPEYSPSMGYKHPNTTSETESDEIIKSGVKELVPILNAFEDIEYVEASLPDPEIVSAEEENVVHQEEEENNIYDDLMNDPLLEEADLFLASDNSTPPGIENFPNDSERDIRFLEALLIDDSIPFSVSEESDFDNLSFPRSPPEPPDFKTDAGEEILVVMNDIVEFESLNPRDEFDDDNYSSFMFLIYLKVFSFLSAQSEDTIFDPCISV
nr:hypothetical protein [Tanacetum cinerariifolium]